MPAPASREIDGDTTVEDKIIKRRTWAIIVVVNLLLLFLILVSPRYPIYDEGYYLGLVKLLRADGLSVNFLRTFPGPAGPLHTVVYDAYIRLFGLSFPYIRLLSFAFLLASAWVWAGVARGAVGLQSPHRIGPGLLAGIMTVVPTAAVSAGMALTEMPAFFLLSVFLLGLSWSLDAVSRAVSILSAGAAGLVLGFAILGRQNYLVLLPCLVALYIDRHEEWWQLTVRLGVLCFVALAVTAPVFVIWGGLTPAKSQPLTFGISLWNAVLAMGYAGIIAFLVAPELFDIAGEVGWIALVATAPALLVWHFAGTPMIPMHTALAATVGGTGATMAGAMFGVAMALTAMLFVICLTSWLWRNRNDRMMLFCGAAALAGLASTAKITHQFSSRYVFVCLPLLLAALARTARSSWHLPLRVALAGGLGLLSLSSYLLP